MSTPFIATRPPAVASDGGVRKPGLGKPHPRSYGTNARVFADYVRGRPVLTMEEAVRRMTSLPAQVFGFKDRGLIREGAPGRPGPFRPRQGARPGHLPRAPSVQRGVRLRLGERRPGR